MDYSSRQRRLAIDAASAGELAESVNGALSYLLADGLGSVSEAIATNGTGSVSAAQLYGPYGAVRYQSGTLPTSKGYTGQRADATTSGLDYYGARYYDAVAGQFTSADTTLAGGLNEYAYVGGNPESATDATGHYASACDTWLCGGEGMSLPGNGGSSGTGSSSSGSGSGGGNGLNPGGGSGGDGSGASDPLAPLRRAINWASGQGALTKVIPLGNHQRITLYMDGVSLQVIFSTPGAQDVNINVTDTPELGMWSDILTMLVYGGGSHTINLGTGLGDPAAAVNRITQQLQQATGGVVDVQNNLNPQLQIAIKGPTKVAVFRISPNGTLPGGAKGGPEFRIGIESGTNVPYLTFGGRKSSDLNATHFWLGSQVYNPDVAQAMVFTMLNQYYQNSFPNAPTYP